ncbi:hypothetical protein SCHPADRAFT_892068 [Schizopora paradoxa]|uniref:Uncharacterized protein n=1 Tax=Schizopora paradoxa TaxID=27342 RepID=A0A0H2S1C1_9AGAM|nr:hypothetical protein SCHPADRAFT_892068 [Schizopora paradoxa]
MKVAFSALLALSLIATSVATNVADVSARAANAVAERDTSGEKFDHSSDESSKIDEDYRIPDIKFDASGADKVSRGINEGMHELTARATTCSLKNKDGICDAFTCLRGTGKCSADKKGNCKSSGLTGERSSVACNTCQCTPDEL